MVDWFLMMKRLRIKKLKIKRMIKRLRIEKLKIETECSFRN